MIIDAKHINYIPGMDMVNQRLGEGYRTGWGIVVGDIIGEPKTACLLIANA